MTKTLNGLRVLVTRPQPQADRLAAYLEGLGAKTAILPMIAIQSCKPETLPANIDLTEYSKVIVISVPAVEQFFALKPANSMTPAWVTPGQGTADALKEYGITAHCPDEEFTSEAMLNLEPLQQVSGQKILLIKGEGGRDTLAETLTDRGADVSSLIVYQRICPDYPAGMLDRTVEEQQISAIVATSGQIVINLLECSSKPELLRDIPLLVPSPRVASLAMENGFKKVITTPGAGDSDIATALLQLL
ncbi:uroporphyrinogen-III synthase [Parendozoicomonas haliclonae]|uniref:Uroporphyrinogen-III synthase n=1 Tax=Parendozoicomonas haliclonae TaxID=1960125 RepID=A0A1X7AJA7_9GAMM|nr:uroporphyrinogen-III synthase [Parendozoicomonas haliclonae]SMA45824.1 Uroporphyrinogen-III synthase [Parendozoicomonas haliclonae]